MATGSIQVQPAGRIRGPNLRVLATFRNGLPFREAWLRAEEEGLVIASNARLDLALNSPAEYIVKQVMRALASNVKPDQISVIQEWEQFPELWPADSGTMIGHLKWPEKLGTEIVYTDPDTNERWIFPVPEGFRGERNLLLVAEHPDYSLRFEGIDIIIDSSSVGAVDNFPDDGFNWYLVDKQHKIPFGPPFPLRMSHDKNQRWLERLEGCKVGPITRFSGTRSNVSLHMKSFGKAGIAVEAPAEETERAPTPTQ